MMDSYLPISSFPQKASPPVRKLELIQSVFKNQVSFLVRTGLGIDIAQFLEARQMIQHRLFFQP